MPFRLSAHLRSSSLLTLACAAALFSAPACDCRTPLVAIKGGLTVNPTEIDFMAVPIGTVNEVTVQVKNLGRGTINVTSIALETPSLDVAIAKVLLNDCQNVARPASSAMAILGGTCATFSVRYGPKAQVDLANNILITSNDTKNPVIKVPLKGTGVSGQIRACIVDGTGSTEMVETACTPVTSPSPTLNFGAWPIDQKATRKVRVFNDGKYALSVSDAHIESMVADFSLIGAPLSAVVKPMDYVDLVVQFNPQSDAMETGDLIIPSTDQANPKLVIPLAGTSLGPKLCLNPGTTIDFGSVPKGTSRELSLTLSNCGEADYQITNLQLLNNGSSTVFTTPATGTGAIPTLPLAFPAGATLTINVTYSPIYVSPPAPQDTGYFSIKTDYQRATVMVLGKGAFPGCNAGGTNLTPVGNIAVKQGAALVDPTTTTFDPLTTADLDGSASVAPSPEIINGYQWRLKSQPSGSTAHLGGTGAKVSLFMEIVGDYVVELVVTTNDMCQSPPVDVTIHVKSRAAVHIQLTWPQAYGDVDLHYIGPGGTFYDSHSDLYWIDSLSTASGPVVPTRTGFGGLDWGLNNTTARDGNPANDASLDIDQRLGNGPENVTHNKPFDGTYKIQVHYYCSRSGFGGSSGPSTPIVKVFIQGNLAWSGTAPSMLDNQVWAPANVVVANGGTNITVVPAANQTALMHVSQGCGG